MAWLVAFRALQGVGAGCLLSVALTMVGDLFTIEQHARMQGIFSSVSAVAALAGPTLRRGLRLDDWLNLPIGVVAAARTPLLEAPVRGTAAAQLHGQGVPLAPGRQHGSEGSTGGIERRWSRLVAFRTG
jgi:MFS family permease